MVLTNLTTDQKPITNGTAKVVPLDINLEGSEKRPYYQRQQTSISEAAKTDWRSLFIAYMVMLINGIQFSLRISSLWPFLQQVDPDARPTFFGWLVAGFSVGSLVASPLFGMWGNRIKQVRFPVAVGVVLTIIGNILLCVIENFPKDSRKWIMLFGRVVMGLGSGTAGLMRAFTAMSSTAEDRQRAVSLASGAFAFGMVIGPGIQAMFEPINYPGYVINNFHLDMYTVPGYFATIFNVVIIILLYTLFKENYVSLDEGSGKKTKNPFKPVPKYDRLIAWFCVWLWFNLCFCYTNLETIGSPFTMAMFSWNNQQAVLYNGIVQAISGVIGLFVYVVTAALSNKVHNRAALISGLILVLSFYLITFSWPSLPHMPSYKIQDLGNSSLLSNATDASNTGLMLTEIVPNTTILISTTTMPDIIPVGCETYYKWCKTTTKVELSQYLVGMLLVSFGFPLTNAVLAPLFSKVLGPRRQELMQGALVAAGSLARFIGPIFISNMFDLYGPKVPWAVTIIMTIITIIFCGILYKRLVPLDPRTKMKEGDYFEYKNGTLYHL